MFLYPDGTFIIQLVNFAIFLAILNVVFMRPVAAAIRRRRDYINSLVTDYDRYQDDAKALRKEAESVRASARRDAEHAIASARAQASNESAEVAATYARRVQHMVEEATATVTREFENAHVGVGRATATLAALMLERILPEAN